MTKREFLTALNEELLSLSEEERSAAIKYYSDYIDDAGSENLDAVLAELGTPAQVAASIKADSELSGTSAASAPPPPAQKCGGLPGWAAVLLAVLLALVWVPLLAAACSLVLAVIGLFIGLFAAGIVLVLGGLVLAVVGIITLFGSPLPGLLLGGAGLLLGGVGLLLLLLAVFLCAGVTPALVSGIGRALRLPGRARQEVR